MKRLNLFQTKENMLYLYKLSFYVIIMIILSITENFLPRLFILKIGISNSILLLILRKLNLKDLILIQLIRIIFTNIFIGTIFSISFILSLSGNIIALLLMYFVSKNIKIFSIFSVSIIGSISSNIIQYYIFTLIMSAKFQIKNNTLFNYIIIYSVVTGLISAVISKLIRKYLERKKIEIIR